MNKRHCSKLNLELGQTVKHHREIVKNYSQAKLSELTGLSVTTISRIEQGTQRPNLVSFIKLCYLLNINSEKLTKKLYYIMNDDEADDL